MGPAGGAIALCRKEIAGDRLGEGHGGLGRAAMRPAGHRATAVRAVGGREFMQVDLVRVDPLMGQAPDFFLDPAFDRIPGKRKGGQRVGGWHISFARMVTDAHRGSEDGWVTEMTDASY